MIKNGVPVTIAPVNKDEVGQSLKTALCRGGAREACRLAMQSSVIMLKYQC